MKVNVKSNKEKWLIVDNGKGEMKVMRKMTKYKMRK